MIEWSFFYKVLDIPEAVTEPTYYQLLGIDPRMCTAELVAPLEERRKRLRHNIPGPQFVPLVLRFEKQQLEVAAAVLSDDGTRRQYK